MFLNSKNVIELANSAIMFSTTYNIAVIDLDFGEYGVLCVLNNIELGFTSVNSVVLNS